MGKRDKEHRKKVQARNQKIKIHQQKLQKAYTQMFEKLKDLQERYSGDTEGMLKELSGETTNE
jgi:hypothetical protein